MKRKFQIGCGTIVGLFVLLIVIGAVVGGGTSGNTSATTTTQTVAQSPTTHSSTTHTSTARSSTTTTHTTRAVAQSAETHTKTTRTSTTAVHHHRHHWPRYAGLGSTVADFKHDNNMFCMSCALQPGEAAYNIKGQRNGRVTEYDVSEDFKPAASATNRLELVSGTMIPGPITAPVRQTAYCIDWRVPQLKKLIGMEYAEASTGPYSTMATMQAVSTPGC